MIPLESGVPPEARPPRPAGARPRRVAASCAFAALLLAACANEDAGTVQPPVVLGMTPSVAAYYSDAQLTLYEVQKPVPLPVRPPTDAEKAALGKQDPYPRAPYLLASDLRIEVHYTLSNLDDVGHDVELLFDPWNEFVYWSPGVTVVSDEVTTPNRSGWDKYVHVDGKSRVEGNLTSDDTNELAVDLATVMAIAKNPPGQNASVDETTLMNHVFDLQNRSNDGDPLIAPYLPKVVAGLTGFDLGLRTTEPATVAVEITVDVTDLNGNRLLPQGSTQTPLGQPGTALAPPGARAAM
jgi:hypothetical protein